MKKTVICNVPMKKTDRLCYKSADRSVGVSEREVIYPISALLEKNLTEKDEVKVVMLVKRDPLGDYKKNAAALVEEMLSVNENIGAKIEFETIESEFDESQSVHEGLLGKIVDAIEDGTRLLADITYGPKDLPIVLFSALGFAEKFLGCEIDNIVYGQVNFVDDKPENPRICDMSALYYLSAVTSSVRSENSERARQMLKLLLSM